MTVCKALPLVAMLVAVPFAAGAQFGGMPGLPGGPPGRAPDASEFWPAPPPLTPACQQFLALRKETQTHAQAIQKASQRKASAGEMCRLMRAYISAVTKFIREIEEHGSTCAPRGAWKQQKDIYATAAQYRRQVCEAAARGPSLLDASLLDPSFLDSMRVRPTPREKPWPPGDYGVPGDRLPGR